MYPPLCAEIRLNSSGYPRSCCLDAGHDGDHMEISGDTWAPPGETLMKLNARWGRTHRIAWTGRLWLATDRNPSSHWRTEVEPTPEQLEMSLRRHHGPPPGPATESAASSSPPHRTHS